MTRGVPPACRLARAWFLAALLTLLAAARCPAAGEASAPSMPASGTASTSAATTATATAPAPAAATQPAIPAPDSFRVFDRPSDDGSEVLLTWPKPDNVPKEANFTYIIEIAGSPGDFESGSFKTLRVPPSPRALASASPQYFGHSDENDRTYYGRFSPADRFMPEPPPITVRRLDDFAAKGLIARGTLARAMAFLAAEANRPADHKPTAPELAEREWYQGVKAYLTQQDQLDDYAARGILTPEILARAKAALAVTQKPRGYQPTDQEKNDQKWFQRLTAYLGKQDQKTRKALAREVSGGTYYYRLAVLEGGRKTYVSRDGKPMVMSAAAHPDLFNWTWTNNLVLALFFCGAVLVFIEAAKRRPGMFIRKIAGLEAVDEAIGRSTEMDRPVYFVHGGVSDMGDVATIASVNILARVARRVAEHDSRIRVMNNDPIVTAVCQEVVQQAYKEAGRPDAFNADDVSLVASDQFSYVAAVSGKMVRERPGAIFLLGSFYAESLLLAETGAATGAIQVAGTDQYTQLPFFITTCDYTLIGEELYAASAYLAREPRMLGSLRGQDVGKAFLMIVMVVVTLALTVAAALSTKEHPIDWIWLRDLFLAGGG